MRLSHAAVSVCIALASLPLEASAAAAPGPSDSGRILINGVADGENVTYPMNPADGALEAPIAGGRDAVYSPNGAWVVYSHDADPCTGYPICNSSLDLWLANANGTSERFLVKAQEGETGEANNVRPDWSPDGTRILFQHPNGTSWVRPDGSGPWVFSGIGRSDDPVAERCR